MQSMVHQYPPGQPPAGPGAPAQGYPPQQQPQGYPPQQQPQGYPPQQQPQGYRPQAQPQGYPPQQQPQGYPPQQQPQGYPPEQQQPQGYPPEQQQPQGYPPEQQQQPQAYPPQQQAQAPYGHPGAPGPGQPGAAPGQTAPAANKGGVKKTVIVFVAISVVLAIATAAIVIVKGVITGSSDSATLLDWTELPEGTQTAGKMPLRLAAVTPFHPDWPIYNDSFGLASRLRYVSVRPEELPEEGLWSYLGHVVCGGEDVYATLMLAQNSMYYALSAGAKPSREALQCGKAVAESLGSQSMYLTQTKDESSPVWLLDAALPKLPGTGPLFKPARLVVKGGTTTSNTAGWTDMHCRYKKDQQLFCEDIAWAAAKRSDRDVWALGFYTQVRQFAQADFEQQKKLEKEDPDRDEIRESYALIRELVTLFEGYTVWTVRHDEPSYSEYSGLDTPLDSFALVSTREDAQSEIIDEHNDDVKAWAYGEKHEGSKISLRLEYRLDNEAAAKGFGSGLVGIRNKVKARIEAGKADPEDDKLEEQPEKVQAALKATRKARRRALAAAKVTVKGKAVVVTLTAEHKPDEQKAIDAYYAWRKPHSEAAARIVQDVIAGKEAADSDLKILGGKELVDGVHSARKENKD